ncbi:MAG: hypothetical protein ACFFDI_17010 [Promethearchaeota archaeon]
MRSVTLRVTKISLGPTSLGLINQLPLQITPQAPPFRMAIIAAKGFNKKVVKI